MRKLLSLLLFPVSLFAQATVNWTNTHQVIDGFGASDWGTSESMTSAQSTLFFSPSSGVGLSLVRTLLNEECGYSSVPSSPPDLTTLQAAVSNGAKVWATMQSPPLSMKDTGVCGTGNLLTADYSAYATYMEQWATMLSGKGVPLYAISVVNEPDVAISGTSNNIGGFAFGSSLSLTQTNLDTFVKTNLGPTFSGNTLGPGGTAVKLMIDDDGQWAEKFVLVKNTMQDSSASPFISILGAHGYGYFNSGSYGTFSTAGPQGAPDGFGTSPCCSTVTTVPYSTSTGQLWQTEVNGASNSSVFDGSIGNGLVYARQIHDYLTVANATAWSYWMMLYGESGDNEGLTDSSGNAAKRLYVIGNWSKFVRPGWIRIDTTTNPQTGIYVTAFKNTSTGAFAIVVLNDNTGSGSTTQVFDLTNFPAITANTVTPWITSSSQSLVNLAPVTGVSSGFSYAVPNQSVMTFVGTASGSSPTTYVSQSGGTFSGGSNCNGQPTETIATFNSTALVSGDTYYLCGVITTSVSLDGSGTSVTDPVNIIFDTGARVSLPECATVCFNMNGASFVNVNLGVNCGYSTACWTAEQANPTGYPSGIGGIIEATQAGSAPLPNQPTSGDLVSGSGSNVSICCGILRNLYQHTSYSDPAGGGGAFVAIASYGGNNITAHDLDIHDSDTVLNNASGPGCSEYHLYNSFWSNINWGFHGGTQPGVTCSDWEIHDNYIGSVIKWDQAANNNHGNPVGFLSRGGVAQGSGSYNGVYIYNNVLVGPVSTTANGACAPGDAGNHKTSLMYFSGGPIVNAYIYNNVFDISTSPCGVDDAMLTLNGEAGSSTWLFNNTILDSPTVQSGEGCNSNGAGTIVEANNAEQNCNNYQYVQGTVTFPSIFDYNGYGGAGTGGAGLWQAPWGNTSTFATWLSTMVSPGGCVVPSNGCETHSFFQSAAGSLKLGTNDVPLSGSPLISAGTPPCNYVTCTGQLAALLLDTTYGNSRTPTTRSAPVTIGAYNFSGGTLPSAANPICTPPGLPGPQTGTYSVPQVVSCTTTSPGAIMCYTLNGAAPVPNSTGGCSTGTLYTGSFGVGAFGVTNTLVQIIAGGSGYNNSSNVLYTYIVNPSVVAPAQQIFARSF
jgi:glucuronoarabinoxylan endo-1,4-beta-xylanase